MKPPKSILDRAFKWTPPAKQDCAATFRRVRKEMEAQKQATDRVVTPMPARKHP